MIDTYPKQCPACGSFCGGGYDGKPCKNFTIFNNQNKPFCDACAKREAKISKLELQLLEAQAIIVADCENEAAARKAAGHWDRSNTYGVESLADIIERLVATIDNNCKL